MDCDGWGELRCVLAVLSPTTIGDIMRATLNTVPMSILTSMLSYAHAHNVQHARIEKDKVRLGIAASVTDDNGVHDITMIEFVKNAKELRRVLGY